jgi:hypothetical protein
MKDLDSLVMVYRMASANQDRRLPEEMEALGAMRRYIEANFPLRARTILWDIDLHAEPTRGHK